MSAQLQQPELAGMKPAQISKLLKVDVREVYAAKQRALHQAKKSRHGPTDVLAVTEASYCSRRRQRSRLSACPM